jgi:hypothetical protein
MWVGHAMGSSAGWRPKMRAWEVLRPLRITPLRARPPSPVWKRLNVISPRCKLDSERVTHDDTLRSAGLLEFGERTSRLLDEARRASRLTLVQRLEDERPRAADVT